ncbi:hypothetical protein BH23ACI1_BH23ACI1_21850 [soil metagenome]
MPALLSLALISAATAIVLLLVVRYTSDQHRIASVKRAIRAGLFEIRLFNDDLRAILRAQAEILRHNLTYLRLSAVPLLWVAIPLVILMGQLQACYGYDGLYPGQSALFKVELSEAASGSPELRLDSPPGIRVETPPVWIPSLHEATWRIAAERAGDYELSLHVAGESFTKRVRVSTEPARRSPVRLEPGIFTRILYPAEAPLPSGASVRSIALTYPDRSISWLGWDTHWMVIFFVLTLLFAVLLRRPFGVVL